MNKNNRVTWVDGVGFEHIGVVARDIDVNEFMIPILKGDGTIIKVDYKNLHIYRYKGRE